MFRVRGSLVLLYGPGHKAQLLHDSSYGLLRHLGSLLLEYLVDFRASVETTAI
ncbi:hypothetical protein D3C79_1084470 [compost metagenome]